MYLRYEDVVFKCPECGFDKWSSREENDDVIVRRCGSAARLNFCSFTWTSDLDYKYFQYVKYYRFESEEEYSDVIDDIAGKY